jgi:DNA-directed RNA polymerase subunit RPC12/RpoP
MGKSQGHNDRCQCPQCGADISLSPKRRLGNCPFCGSRLYMEPREVETRWMLRPVLMRSECHRILSAWLWENYQGTASGLEISQSLWVPWLRKERRKDGQFAGHSYELAEKPADPHIARVKIPPGEYVRFDSEKTAGFVLPEVPDEKPGPGGVIIYIPFHVASFSYGGERRSAAIEASTGSLAGYQPDKKAKISFQWGSLAIAGVIFLLEGMLIKPVIAKTIVLGLSFVILEIGISLLWEGWGWRK